MTWDRYLERFHASRPGITEAVLRRSLHTGGGAVIDPYRWLAEAVPARGRMLDLGCGSAPLWKELTGRDYLGLDPSDAELAAARAAGAGPLLRASAAAIPLRGGSLDVVACSMSLMVFSPLPQALADVARVLRPGGRLVATAPAGGPLRGRDILVVAGLLAALGRTPGYPAGRELGRLPAHLAQAACGWLVTSGAVSATGSATRPAPRSSSQPCTCPASPRAAGGWREPACGCWPGSAPNCPSRCAGSSP